ncbi:unnamed protein product [Protopolystoma xenopodis]|uniref:Uncharacterized protein n=1 Tax=Protopolystoma xenopodis TaxID=117903 RepID=A0A3S4ZFY8_9PLAT|nr:unnamed protein product [Protopolystoma xenopodis]
MESLLPNRCAARQPSRNSENEAVSELKAVASPQGWAHEVSCAKEGKWTDSQSLNPCAIPQLCNACVTHTFCSIHELCPNVVNKNETNDSKWTKTVVPIRTAVGNQPTIDLTLSRLPEPSAGLSGHVQRGRDRIRGSGQNGLLRQNNSTPRQGHIETEYQSHTILQPKSILGFQQAWCHQDEIEPGVNLGPGAVVMAPESKQQQYQPSNESELKNKYLKNPDSSSSNTSDSQLLKLSRSQRMSTFKNEASEVNLAIVYPSARNNSEELVRENSAPKNAPSHKAVDGNSNDSGKKPRALKFTELIGMDQAVEFAINRSEVKTKHDIQVSKEFTSTESNEDFSTIVSNTAPASHLTTTVNSLPILAYPSVCRSNRTSIEPDKAAEVSHSTPLDRIHRMNLVDFSRVKETSLLKVKERPEPRPDEWQKRDRKGEKDNVLLPRMQFYRDLAGNIKKVGEWQIFWLFRT